MGHITQVKELLSNEGTLLNTRATSWKEVLCLRDLHDCLFCQDCRAEVIRLDFSDSEKSITAIQEFQSHLSGAPESFVPQSGEKSPLKAKTY